MVAGVLPPSGGQPIRRHTGRMRSADHPAEEARTRHGAQPWRAQRHEFLDNLGFRFALLRRQHLEYFAHCRIAAWWCGLANRIAISDGVLCCQGKQRLERHQHTLRSSPDVCVDHPIAEWYLILARAVSARLAWLVARLQRHAALKGTTSGSLNCQIFVRCCVGETGNSAEI